jgi:hypothetical protein
MGGGAKAKIKIEQGKQTKKKIRAPEMFEKNNSCGDFSIGKIISWKKKIRARDYLKKKITNTAKNVEKKFVHAENGPHPPPHHFSNGPPLNKMKV